MTSLNQYFRISLKRFESQFSIYENGGFYKIHLDQHKKSPHRLITCCLYLNDCIQGGELIIYKKGSRKEIDLSISPKKGSIVFFLSPEIYHEVRPVVTKRLSITTWFRNDYLLPIV